VEDPFSVLSALVPDSLCAPLVTPLFPPPTREPSQIHVPLPIHISPPEVPREPPEPVPQPTGGTKYRHWTILRSAPPRGKAKETAEERPPTPEWRKPRPLDATDFGVFPVFATNSSLGGSGATEVLGTQERLFDVLHTKLESALCSETSVDRAIAAQSWLREVVFGGFDGLAYVRSVAEFLTPSSTANDQDPNPTLAGYVDATLIDELTDRRHRVIEATLKGSKAVDQKPPVAPLSEPPFVPLPPTPLDLGSLISAPNELFDAENVWAGAGANEDSAVLSRALDHAAHILEQLHEVYTQRAEAASSTGTDVKFEETVDKEQDMVTELRMNLIALAKRAPVDQIAKIPSDLVPPHLRGIIPTIDR
jgi:bromodomain-containing protein 7